VVWEQSRTSVGQRIAMILVFEGVMFCLVWGTVKNWGGAIRLYMRIYKCLAGRSFGAKPESSGPPDPF
jgi:hypothetical protein